MTNQILQTDIELARKLMAEGVSDQEIVRRLVLRRIVPESAERLVHNLRNGVEVRPETEVNYEWGKAITGTNSIDVGDEELEAESSDKHKHRKRHHQQGKGSGIVWVLIILILVVVGAGAWYFMSSSNEKPGGSGGMEAPTEQETTNAAPASETATNDLPASVPGTNG